MLILELAIPAKPLAFNALLQLNAFHVKGNFYSTQHACQYVPADHSVIHLKCTVLLATYLYVNNASNLQDIAPLALSLKYSLITSACKIAHQDIISNKPTIFA